MFTSQEGVQIKHNGQKPSTDLYELNPDHTHFIMTEDENRDTQLSSTRCIIEKQLQQKFGHKKHQLIRLMSVGKYILIFTCRVEYDCVPLISFYSVFFRPFQDYFTNMRMANQKVGWKWGYPKKNLNCKQNTFVLHMPCVRLQPTHDTAVRWLPVMKSNFWFKT